MVTTVIEIRNESGDAADGNKRLVTQANAIILYLEHIDGEVALDRIEDEFNRPIHRVVRCTEDKSMTSSINQCCHMSVVMRAESVV